MRAVLDTNILVSAFIRTRGRVMPLWQAARERRYQLVLSPAIIAEVAETLRKDFSWEERRLINRSKLMARMGEMVVPRLVIDVVLDDPDDNRILECAVEGKADLIVSGDRDLLRLKSYQAIPIVRPIDFLRTLDLV
jgi:putative PIN family toxin of toxin-antitoxin system